MSTCSQYIIKSLKTQFPNSKVNQQIVHFIASISHFAPMASIWSMRLIMNLGSVWPKATFEYFSTYCSGQSLATTWNLEMRWHSTYLSILDKSDKFLRSNLKYSFSSALPPVLGHIEISSIRSLSPKLLEFGMVSCFLKFLVSDFNPYLSRTFLSFFFFF